jgi:hypothetical protein
LNAAISSPTKVLHMTPQPTQQIPGVYHRRIGDIVVTAISDGYLDGGLDVMRNVDLEKATQLLRDAFRPARRTSVNAFVIHSKGRRASTPARAIISCPPPASFNTTSRRAASIRSRSIQCS